MGKKNVGLTKKQIGEMKALAKWWATDPCHLRLTAIMLKAGLNPNGGEEDRNIYLCAHSLLDDIHCYLDKHGGHGIGPYILRKVEKHKKIFDEDTVHAAYGVIIRYRDEELARTENKTWGQE